MFPSNDVNDGWTRTYAGAQYAWTQNDEKRI